MSELQSESQFGGQEQAPTTMDEAIGTTDFNDLDISSMDTNDIIENLEGFGEIDDSLDFPHIKVNSKQFIETLKIAKVINSAGGKDVVSKSVLLEPVGNSLKIYSTDFNVYIENEVEILNYQNILQEPIMLSTDVIIKLLQAVGTSVIFFKKEDLFYIRLFGGDMVIETYQFNTDKFKYQNKLNHVADLNVEDLKIVLRDMSAVVNQAISPVEKRIICDTDEYYVNYMWSHLIAKRTGYPMDLKPKDIKVLQPLLTNKEGIIQVFQPEDDPVQRLALKIDNFTYVFIVSDISSITSSKKDITDVINAPAVYVDTNHFASLIWLAANLPYAIGQVGIQLTDDSISIDIKNKKEKGSQTSKMKVLCSRENATYTFTDEIVVQAKLLSVLLKSFKVGSVKLHITKNGLGISSDNYSAVIYTQG